MLGWGKGGVKERKGKVLGDKKLSVTPMNKESGADGTQGVL